MSNTTLFLIAIAVIMMAAVPVAMMLKDFLPNIIEKTAGFDQLENRIYVLHAEGHDLQDRVNGLVQRRNQQSSEKHRIETDIRKTEKLINELTDQPPLFVHEVGDPQSGLVRFTATVTQDKASSEARASGAPPVNPIWRQTNVAEVWATNLDEAKQMLEVAFPFKLGYHKDFHKLPRGTKAAAQKAAAPKPARVPAS